MTQRNRNGDDPLSLLGAWTSAELQEWLARQKLNAGGSVKLSFKLRQQDGEVNGLELLIHDHDDVSSDGWLRLVGDKLDSVQLRADPMQTIFISHHGSDHHSMVREHAVPRLGEILLYFALPKNSRDALPGCLAEEFNAVIVPKMGLRLARLWYWAQVLRALPWVRLVAIYEFVRWKIGR